MNKHPTRLIALDWGTTSLRAYRLGEDGAVLDNRGLPWGIMNLPVVEGDFSRAAGFAKAFDEACSDWLRDAPGTPLIAAGMVGSAQGWREAAYIEIPLAIADVGKQLTRVDLGDGRGLHIVPGLLQHSTLPNVIRGEETQVVGALDAYPPDSDLLIGLPGTHSKWVRIESRSVTHFDTFMTGEVYAALIQHTILGRTMVHSAHDNPAAFARGVRVAASTEGGAGLLSNIFSSRTLGLTGELNAEAQPDYLSGLLIGHEITALFATRHAAGDTSVPHIVLIGEGKLCARYQAALRLHGCSNIDIAAHAAERGLWKIARQAGLV